MKLHIMFGFTNETDSKIYVSTLFPNLGNAAYEAMIVRDDKNNSASVKIENKTMKKGESINIETGVGGFIAKFIKK